jgi:hypothetical protein
MSSTISLGEKVPVAKIALFRAFQMDHKVACQIIRKPLRILPLLPDPFTISKREDKEGGIIIETPIHLNTSLHTLIALGQCKKR